MLYSSRTSPTAKERGRNKFAHFPLFLYDGDCASTISFVLLSLQILRNKNPSYLLNSLSVHFRLSRWQESVKFKIFVALRTENRFGFVLWVQLRFCLLLHCPGDGCCWHVISPPSVLACRDICYPQLMLAVLRSLGY